MCTTSKTKGGRRHMNAASGAAETGTTELNAASDAPEARADPAKDAIEEVMEEVEESERLKLVRSPDSPPQAAIEEHESTGHVVYRDCAGIASQDAVWDKDTRQNQ